MSKASIRMASSSKHACAALAAALLILVAAPSAKADPAWQLEANLPIPPGSIFLGPLGAPADLKCWSVSRCVLLTTGTGTGGFSTGIFYYNGAAWKQLSTVCGIEDPTYGRIVWGGPTDFWIIGRPSPPRGSAGSDGQGLCHFAKSPATGALEIVGSYSTRVEDPDRFLKVNSGACTASNDCWFGGAGEFKDENGNVVGGSPNGDRVGAFHLHWDGTKLKPVYVPPGRAVTDLESSGSKIFEGRRIGGAVGERREIVPVETVSPAPLLNRITAVPEINEPFEPDPLTAANSGDPGMGEATEVLTLDRDRLDASAGSLWAGGGSATSGAGFDPLAPFNRGPFAARLVGDTWNEVPLQPGVLTGSDTITDVAAMPGRDAAYAVVSGSVPAPKVARLASDGAVSLEDFATTDTRGSAAVVDCPALDNCWLATSLGWLYQYVDAEAPALPVDGEQAFQTLVNFRPNETVEQAIGDDPPVDDSLLFAPATQEPEVAAEQAPESATAAVRTVRSKLKGTRLTISFFVVRKARVTITARRKGKVVATAKSKLLRRGNHSLTLRLKRKQWPTRISMKVTEPRAASTSGITPPNNPFAAAAISSCFTPAAGTSCG